MNDVQILKKAQQKKELQVAIDYMTQQHLWSSGGYPHDYETIGDLLIVAGTNPGKDDNQTQLYFYSIRHIKRELEYAVKCAIKAHPAYDRDALFDNEEATEFTGPLWDYFEPDEIDRSILA